VVFTLDQIRKEWFGGDDFRSNAVDVEQAFNLAERVRGREWVLGREVDLGGSVVPGIGRRGGFTEFLRVWWFGERVQFILGAVGSESLLDRLLTDDPSANAELTAIYLLRKGVPNTELEIAPPVAVGLRRRKPDFRIREQSDDWTYVEVTKLRESVASTRMQALLNQVTDRIISIMKEFLLELVFWRQPTDVEIETVLTRAAEACNSTDVERVDIDDVASVIVKSGNPAVVVPSSLGEDGTRMSAAKSIVGPDQPNRQIVVRAPFADERAEDVMTSEAKQLPKSNPGLIMVDVAKQPSAFESWSELVPQRFTPRLHTRVGGVLLFMFAMSPSADGILWLPYLKLIENPHAAKPLPHWIPEVINEKREGSRRARGAV